MSPHRAAVHRDPRKSRQGRGPRARRERARRGGGARLAARGLGCAAIAMVASAALGQAVIERVEVVPETPGAPGPLQTYAAGETFELVFIYNRTLPRAVPGVTATVEFGSAGRVAVRRTTDPCHSEDMALVCPYTVRSTDQDDDGLTVPAAGIAESQGTVLPTRFYDATLAGVGEPLPAHRVDGVSVGLVDASGNPRLVLEVTSQPGDRRAAYRAGEVVRARMRFSEVVDDFGAFAPELVPGRPMIGVGGDDTSRDYIHTVAPGENAGRLAVAALSRMHDIVDVHGNRGIHAGGVPLRENAPGIEVQYGSQGMAPQWIDTSAPSVVDVRLASTRTLLGGGDIDVVVEFDEAVVVDGMPLLRLAVGGEVKRLPLAGGHGAGLPGATREGRRELTFRWAGNDVVRARAEGELGVPENALVFVNAGASVVDLAGNAAGNTPPGFASLGARVDSRPPAVVGVSLPGAREVRAGTMLEFQVVFDEDIEVNPGAGSEWPSMAFTLAGARKRAHYVRHSGATLAFGYTARTADASGLLAVPAGGLMLHGAVADAAGNVAETGYVAPAPRELTVDASADRQPPRLLGVSTGKMLYRAGESVRVELRFSEAIALRGAVELTVAVGTQRRGLSCRAQDSLLLCEGRWDGGSGGRLSWGTAALAGGGAGAVEDLAGNPWAGRMPAGGGAFVDADPPHVTGVRIDSRPRLRQPGGAADDLYYGRGDRIEIAVEANESLRAGNDAAVRLDVGGRARTARYWTGDGTARLVFAYRVAATDLDTDGIGVTGMEGRVEDAAGNPLRLGPGGSLMRHTLFAAGDHPVDGRLTHTGGATGEDAGDRGEEQTGQDEPDEADEEAEEAPAETAPARIAVTSSGSGDDGSYLEGETIVLQVRFPAPGADLRVPLTLELDMGTRLRTVTCAGLGSARLSVECSYRVRREDQDRDGVVVRVGREAVTVGGEAVEFDLTSVAPPSLLVDAQPPTVTRVVLSTDPGADETYVAGDEIGVEVLFSEPVAGRGTLSLPLRIGRAQRRAEQVSPGAGERSARFEFRYALVAGDEDPDGLAVPALGPGSLVGSVRDPAGHEAVLDHPEVADDSRHAVDTRRPSVTSMTVTGAAGRAFALGSTVTVVVAFDERVTVPAQGVALALAVGGAARTAGYVSGSGTDRLTFAYEVVAGDNGGVSVGAGALGPGITDIGGNPAADSEALSLEVSVDTRAPAVAGVPRLVSSPADGVYGVGDDVVVAVGFTEPVLVTVGTTGPALAIAFGGGVRHARYEAGTGTRELRFAYRVAAGDRGDRVSVAADAVELGDGLIRDANGLAAAIAHAPMPATDGHRVDGVAPRIEGVEIVSRPRGGEAYLAGERIVIEVRFGEPVVAAAEVSLALAVGEAKRGAACSLAEDAGDVLRCLYTVLLGDFDPDGVSIPADALGGGLLDVAGNRAALSLDGIADDPRHRVHAAPPDIAGGPGAMTLVAGGPPASVDLVTVFSGHRPKYDAESSDEAVVGVRLAGSSLTVQPVVEGTAVVRVTATNAAGSAVVSFDVRVETDPAEERAMNGTLAAMGRGMLAGMSDTIGARFDLARAGAGATLAVGAATSRGHRAVPGAEGFGTVGACAGTHAPAQRPPGGGCPGRPGTRAGFAGSGVDLRLAGTSAGGMRWSLWAGGDLYGLAEADGGTGTVEGGGATGFVGVDARGDSLVAGLAVSRAEAEADYAFEGQAQGSGAMDARLTGVHPYARLALSDDSEVWMIGGFGSGEVVVHRDDVDRTEAADVNLAMAVAGLRRAFALRFGGATFALRGDAAFLGISGEEGTRAVDGLAVSVSRLRLGLESGWTFGSVSPFAVVSARVDGGDGEAGAGVEVAAGVRIGSPYSAFGLEAKGRTMAVPVRSEGTGAGVSVTAAFEPGRAGRGFFLRLSPAWGGPALASDPFGRVAPAAWTRAGSTAGTERGWRMRATTGYGVEMRAMPGVLTPFAETGRTMRGAPRLRAGLRYEDSGPGRFSRVEASVGRVEGAGDGALRVLLTVEGRH